MSQSGPYPGPSQQPGRDPEEPYTEPVDPWGGQASWPTAAPGSPIGLGSPGYDPSFGFNPVQSADRSTDWPFPPAPPRRRGPGTGIIVLVSVLSVLILVGGGVAWWLLTRPDQTAAEAQPAPSPSSAAPSTASDKTDARFVATGQCVRNEGSEEVPQMMIATCGEGTFEVLERIDGATTGKQDAEKKCASVTGYTNWYFYDSELDALDYVLCLRGR